jgi:hypothetical protein
MPMTSFWAEPDTVSFPLIIGLNLSPVSGAPFDAVEIVGVGPLEAVVYLAMSTLAMSTEPIWFTTATMIPPTVVINAAAIPPILAAEIGSPG